MDDFEKGLLSEDGWNIICDMPLEIEHEETGDTATGLAVLYVIEHLKYLASLADPYGSRSFTDEDIEEMTKQLMGDLF